MIDFVSTRTCSDDQTIACARLLTAVIAAALHDLAEPGTKDDRKEELLHRRVSNSDALASIEFFFGRRSVFPLYARLIGSDANNIRAALLGMRAATDTVKPLRPLISDTQWSTIRRRLHLCGIHSIGDTPRIQSRAA
jgi:hypothetical protein